MLIDGSTQKSLAKSIDGNAYSNIKINSACERMQKGNKKLSVRDLEIRMKKAIKKHRDTFTFGKPNKYTKVQAGINSLLSRIENTENVGAIPYSNEKQKRLYKHELLLESFHNKMGLV